jgi:hypothetical protein
MVEDQEYTKAEQEWIADSRSRLAQRRGRKPATKAAQLRALWPEIRAAIADGQSLASIRLWLEEDAGIVVSVQSLGSYLTRIRRKEQANSITPTRQPGVQTRLSRRSAVESKPPLSNPPSKASVSAKKTRGFEYPPGPPDESKLI